MRRLLVVIGLLCAVLVTSSQADPTGRGSTRCPANTSSLLQMSGSVSGTPDASLAREAMASYVAHGCPGAGAIGLVDFGLASSTPRFWLIALGGEVSVSPAMYVAHGKGSDPTNSGLASIFGNRPDSNQSSLGAYRVAETYTGKHGRSLKVDGLDGSNSNARRRAVVVHTTLTGGRDYVSAAWLERHGQLGRSDGCFVVMPADFDKIQSTLGGGGFLYAGRSTR